MKYFVLIFIFFAFACKTTKSNFNNSLNSDTLKLISECAEFNKCSISVMKNTSMRLLKDDANKLYPEFKSNNETMIVKYTFAVNANEQLSDGHYKEEILFEIANNKEKLVLNDEELSNVKLVHGIFCYCKGTAGYYEISKGKLSIENKELFLEFKNENVAQRVNSIKAKY